MSLNPHALKGRGEYMDKLDAIFAPESIAVIGASTQKGIPNVS